MASLSISVGTTSASIEETNLKAGKVLTTYAEAIGATGTSNEKALQVLRSLVIYIVGVNRHYLTRKSQESAAAALQAELDDMSWG